MRWLRSRGGGRGRWKDWEGVLLFLPAPPVLTDAYAASQRRNPTRHSRVIHVDAVMNVPRIFSRADLAFLKKKKYFFCRRVGTSASLCFRFDVATESVWSGKVGLVV